MKTHVVGRLLFNVLLLGFPAYFFWNALGYTERARLVPILISVVVLLLQLTVVVSDYLEATRSSGEIESTSAETPSLKRESVQVMVIVAWALFYFGAVYLVGFLLGSFAFFASFLWSCARTSWLTALGAALTLVGFVWGLFVKILSFELYSGVLFGAARPLL